VHTRRAYAADLDSFVRFHGGPASSITPEILRSFFATIAHLAPASRARKEASIASFLAWAYRHGLIPADPQPCYTCVYAGVWMIDGYNSPWVWPKEGVYVVGSGTPTQPDVTYPGPSVTDVLYDTTNKWVQARMNGNIFTSGPGGEAYYQFGEQAGNYDTESSPHLTIPPSGDFLVYEDFGFPPGKDVHWRFCYTPTGSGQICGLDQLYKPPPETGIQDISVKKHTAKVSFDSPLVTNMTAHFQCKLDSKAYKPCTSPKKYKDLTKGKHIVSVRAVDQDGHKDSTPAKQAFKV